MRELSGVKNEWFLLRLIQAKDWLSVALSVIHCYSYEKQVASCCSASWTCVVGIRCVPVPACGEWLCMKR